VRKTLKSKLECNVAKRKTTLLARPCEEAYTEVDCWRFEFVDLRSPTSLYFVLRFGYRLRGAGGSILIFNSPNVANLVSPKDFAKPAKITA